MSILSGGGDVYPESWMFGGGGGVYPSSSSRSQSTRSRPLGR